MLWLWVLRGTSMSLGEGSRVAADVEVYEERIKQGHPFWGSP